jgi:hypothetical protein
MSDLREWNPSPKQSSVWPRVIAALVVLAGVGAIFARLSQEPGHSAPKSVVADSELPSPSSPVTSR